MTSFAVNDSFTSPSDENNPLRSLYELLEQASPPVPVFRCPNSECQEVFTYNKNLLTARKLALNHFPTYVKETPLLAQLEGLKVSMHPTISSTRAAVLDSVVHNIPIGPFCDDLLLEWHASILHSSLSM